MNPVVERVLARYRADANITQKRLAEAAGLDSGYISLIERDHRMLTIDTILRLCRGLKAAPSQMTREIEKRVAEMK